MKNSLKKSFSLIFIFGLAIVFFKENFIQAEEIPNVSATNSIHPSTTTSFGKKIELQTFLTSKSSIILSSAPAWNSENFLLLNLKTYPSQTTPEGKQLTRISMELLPVTLGNTQTPPLSIAYQVPPSTTSYTLETEPISVFIQNTLKPEKKPKFYGIKGPLGPSGSLWGWILFAILTIAGGIAFWFYKEHKKKQATPIPKVPLRPAREIALEKLALLMTHYQEDQDTKFFYIDLSIIMREFLSRQFSLDALEKTTLEIFISMRQKEMERSLCLETREILSSCDLVKFAKFSPDVKQIETDFETVKSFIIRQSPNEKKSTQEDTPS